MPTVKIDYFGIEGIGSNVTAAKRDAGAQIERIIKNLHPRIFSHRGSILVCWQDKYGAQYTITDSEDIGQKVGSNSGGADLAEAEERGIRHLIDNTRAEGEYELPTWTPVRIVKKCAALWAADWKQNDIFQSRYRDALARGMTEGDAYDFAHRNPSRPELWAHAAA